MEQQKINYAEICFNAYRTSMKNRAYDGTSIPEWGQLKQDIQVGWTNAALAVVTTFAQSVNRKMVERAGE